ncbi:MAG: hypothetical protein HZB53_16905 [Chloroflexi bacterium]|nr:hypothetical protein [Chloroflexota bacterium]
MQAFWSLLARPVVYWFLVPFVIVFGLFLGITSASAEESARNRDTLPTVVPTTPAPAATPPPNATPAPQGLTGRIVQFDPRSQAIIVLTRANKVVTVTLHPATIARMNGERVRVRDMRLGDVVVVLGKRNAYGGVDATLITIKPRPPASAK